MYRGAEPTLEGQLTPELLDTRRRTLCPRAPTSRGTKRAARRLPVLDAEAFTGIKDGAYAVRDGAIVIRNGNSFEPTSLSGIRRRAHQGNDGGARRRAAGFQDPA